MIPQLDTGEIAMTVHRKWGLAALVLAAGAVGATLALAPKAGAQPQPPTTSGPSGEAVHILIAYSQPLSTTLGPSKIGDREFLLDKSALRTSSGKRIEVTVVGLSSQDIVDRVMNGMLKAHAVITSSAVFVESANNHSILLTGKPILTEKTTVLKQPYVIAVRRQMAEAMNWPTKEIGWSDVAEIARTGWKAAGHPEWGKLKLLSPQDEFGEATLQALMSVAQSFGGGSRELTAEDLKNPKLAETYRDLDNATDWHRMTLSDLMYFDAHNIEPPCHMLFVPEHIVIDLNDRRARKKEPPAWVAVYPKGGTLFGNVTAAVVKREWSSPEQQEAAGIVIKALLAPEIQKQFVARGYRPVTASVGLTEPIDKAWGVNPQAVADRDALPPAELVMDCREVWKKAITARTSEVSPQTDQDAARKAAMISAKGDGHMTPLTLCVRKSKPSGVSITRDVRGRDITGSGVIVHPSGVLVTNSHVVGDAKQVKVRVLSDPDKVLQGEVLISDAARDMALVRILDPGKYVHVAFADSDSLEVGETAVAIGSPFGYTGTVTTGIVSAKGRELQMPSGATLKQLLQTNAAINPGNSGGPLLNLEGELIGLNVAIRDNAQNIGFAIPSNHVRDFVAKNIPR